MSERGEETAGEPSGSQEQPEPAPAEPPKRGPGRPRKPQQRWCFGEGWIFVVLRTSTSRDYYPGAHRRACPQTAEGSPQRKQKQGPLQSSAEES
ncbi:high mobility group protein HMGI-C isoform X2 [Triplophysa rosa]|uniref:high mobility group protein HMGI-C isoform X2 n=1 Tax=Triplophysa rosa TaxID=992332 RepID=UPI0025460EE7|nr:high mobility group protein HMGI-C isoform X2 [Triplophysa rosa]